MQPDIHAPSVRSVGSPIAKMCYHPRIQLAGGLAIVAEPTKRHRRRAGAGAALVLGLLTGACGSNLTQASAMPTAVPAPTPTPTPPPPPSVALLSIDGLRPDALVPGVAPNILALALRGSYTWSAQTVYPSTTLPGHASMLTGLEPKIGRASCRERV